MKSARELIIAWRFCYNKLFFVVVKLICFGFFWGFKFSCDLHLLFLNLTEHMRERMESYFSTPHSLGFRHGDALCLATLRKNRTFGFGDPLGKCRKYGLEQIEMLAQVPNTKPLAVQ